MNPGEIYWADLAGVQGVLDAARMRDVIRALGHVLDSDCEPN
jgi:hypothetical protein